MSQTAECPVLEAPEVEVVEAAPSRGVILGPSTETPGMVRVAHELAGGGRLITETYPPSEHVTRPKQLPRKERIARALAAMKERVRSRADRITCAALLAAEIDDDGPVPEGWTAKQARVARDARQSKRNRPGYIEDAIRISQSFWKEDVDRELGSSDRKGPTINAVLQMNIGPQREYPVLQASGIAETKKAKGG